MKVTFIRPNLYDAQELTPMEVLCFAILKSLTPPDIETTFYDERLAPIPYDEPTDIVALTVETFTARRAYQIADQFRKRGVKVIMGGFHPTFLPEEAAHFADAVVLGDAEKSWPQILEDAKSGKLKQFYQESEFSSIENIKPDRTIFADKSYAPIKLVQYSRGCKFNCSFCSIHAYYGRSMRQRPVQDVVDEIEQLDTKYVLFVDDNIYIDVPKAKELFRELIPLNIKWFSQTSIDVARDREVLKLMEKSGCMGGLIGIESLNTKNLKIMNKSWNLKWSDYNTSIKKLQDIGFMLYGTFVFGYNSDTLESFDHALEFAIKNKFALASFNVLIPTPGTQTYHDLIQENRMIYDNWWLDPRYRYGDAVFHPHGMTADQLAEACHETRKEFFSYKSIMQRFINTKTNLRSPKRAWTYILSNLLLRKEIYAKQGMHLGAQSEEDPYQKIKKL